MIDIVKLYNPANASALTKEQVDDLQKLDSAQIKELAKAYPNMTMGRAYLLIVDSRQPANKQLVQLSTFENLWNLRERNSQRQWVAYGFKGNYKAAPAVSARRGSVKPRKTEVLDLSETDLLNLPGFKTADREFAGQTVKVTQVKKEPVKTEQVQQPEEKPKVKRGRKPKSQTN